MGFAHAGRAEQDNVVTALDEAHPGQFTYLSAVQAGLEVEVELVEGFDPGEPGLAQTGFDTALETALPFGLQRLYQESLVVHLLLGGLLTDGIQLGFQVVHPEFVQQVFEPALG